jgi:hypothetical protein
MSAFETYRAITKLEKQVEEIKALYNNLKSDTEMMSPAQINSQRKKILQKISRIDLELLDENVESLKSYIIYSQVKEKAEDFKNTIEEIKKYAYSLEDEKEVEQDDEEIENVPENKKVNLIRDKYKFLQKLVDTANTETVVKDAKRLESLISRINFEDLPEGDYEEMVNIKNEVSEMINNLEGIEKSEKYGPYILEPLIDLFASIYTLGNKEKAEAKAATVLNFIEDPKHIKMFEPAIKRIIAKKMTPKEFRTFYDSIKTMMRGEQKFESFANYKGRNEYFHLI